MSVICLRSPYNHAAVCPALCSPVYGSDGNLTYNLPLPPPNDAPDEQEQTGYYGQGHEL